MDAGLSGLHPGDQALLRAMSLKAPPGTWPQGPCVCPGGPTCPPTPPGRLGLTGAARVSLLSGARRSCLRITAARCVSVVCRTGLWLPLQP